MHKWKDTCALVTLACGLVAGCGGGDGGPLEKSGPTGTEAPVRGLMGGPSGEAPARTGYEDGNNQQEQSPDASQAGGPIDCAQLSSCDDICGCLGVSGAVCDQYCDFDFDDGDFDDGDFDDGDFDDGDFDDGDFGGDGDGDGDFGGSEDLGDACATLDDPCTRCACENIDDVTVCVDVCADFF